MSTGFRRSRMRNIRLMCAGLFLLVLAGCSEQELYSDLSEQQANDMVALLYGAGMPATKKRGATGSFTVLTDKGSFASAVNLLHANGLPKADFENLGDVFAKEGFVSSPLEERARLNHAMSQEIAHTISSIDGVLMARVHLAVPQQNDLTDKVNMASASVFVKHRANADLSASVSRIKALVVNGVENLPYENVTVALFEADKPMIAAPLANAPDVKDTLQLGLVPPRLNMQSGLVITAALILIAMALVWAFRLIGFRTYMSRLKHTASDTVSSDADNSIR